MLFNSFSFLLFFPVVTVLFYLLPHKLRWLLLLVASCFFYMFFKPVYILILAFTIVIDYYAGIFIEKENDTRKRKLFLTISLIANIGVLAIFKYYNFINDNIGSLLNVFGTTNPIPYLKILLPIGLSFHTFQAMSYTIEVYRGNHKAEKHFGIYALYVMFYPQLVAGPIERPQNILYQFHQHKKYNYNNVVTGLRIMLWGFFKKVVVADRLGVIVDEVYKNYSNYSGLALIVACIFFAFQVYADFSGYSDIAVGTAKVMGYDLLQNFNYPYRSKSLTEYWRRWHISLSTWFNDYLFNPIVLNKRDWGNGALIFGFLITFLISGLWHGASWTFVLWGFLHGLVMCYEFLTKKFRKKMSKKLPAIFYNKFSQLAVFSFIVFNCIFFRSENFTKAFYIIKNLFVFDDSYKAILSSKLFYHFIIGCFAILLLEGLQKLFKEAKFNEYIATKKTTIRWAFYLIMFIAIINFGYFGSNQFIYFQF